MAAENTMQRIEGPGTKISVAVLAIREALLELSGEVEETHRQMLVDGVSEIRAGLALIAGWARERDGVPKPDDSFLREMGVPMDEGGDDEVKETDGTRAFHVVGQDEAELDHTIPLGLCCDHNQALAINQHDSGQQVFFVLLTGGETGLAVWFVVIVDYKYGLDISTSSLSKAEMRQAIVEIYGGYPIVADPIGMFPGLTEVPVEGDQHGQVI